jgi:ACR3 family arsenite efflux pump ArsB
MKKIWGTIEFLKKNLAWSILSFMVMGILVGAFFNVKVLKTFIMPLTFLMVYPMMVTLKINELFEKGGEKANVIALIINFLIIPFIALGIGKLFFKDSPLLIVGLLLSALLPTSGMTISWTGFANGNMHTAIKMTVIGLIVGSIATPIYIKVLVGQTVNIPLISVFRQIILIVFLPMLFGYITQKLLINKFGEKKFNKEIKQKFPVLSTIGVLGIVFVAMALKSKTIISNPTILIRGLVPIVILYVINYTISTFIGKMFLDRDNAIALIYGTVMRNLSIALAIAMSVFGKNGSEIALIIALSYVVQVKSAVWYIKIVDMIFGKKVSLKRG